MGVLLVVVSAACFATLGPLSRFAYADGLTPLTFVIWRAFIGLTLMGLVLFALTRLGRPPKPRRAIPGRAWLLIALAGTASAFMNLAVFVAFERISIALAMLGFYTYPVMLAIVVVMTGRERLDGARVVALVLALLGMTLVVLGQATTTGGPPFDPAGFAIALLAAGLNVVYILLAREASTAIPPRQATLVVLGVSEVWYLVLAVLAGQLALVGSVLTTPAVWPPLLLAGSVGAAIAVGLFLAGLAIIGGVRTSILMLLEPVMAAFLAFLLLGESLTPVQIVGGALVLGAAVLVERRGTVTVEDGSAAVSLG